MKKFLQISGKSIRRVLVLTLLTAMTFVTYGQSREFIRENIRKYGECRNVAITKTNGDVMIYGRNGYATDGCPSGLNNALKELNNEEAYIKDVQLTENGNWLVLYGSNGYRWSNIPYGLQETLSEYNRLVYEEFLPQLAASGRNFHIQQPGIKLIDGKVSMNKVMQGGEIFYRLDDGGWHTYTSPIEVAEGTQIVNAKICYLDKESTTTWLWLSSGKE
jgi:hypothetical protein